MSISGYTPWLLDDLVPGTGTFLTYTQLCGWAASDRVLVVTLRCEEVCPGFDLGVLLEKCSALALGHASPDTELHSIVECVNAALEHHRAMSADDRGFALCSASHEQFIGIDFAAPCPGNPGNACFRLVDVEPGRRGGHVHSVAPLLSEHRYAVSDIA